MGNGDQLQSRERVEVEEVKEKGLEKRSRVSGEISRKGLSFCLFRESLGLQE